MMGCEVWLEEWVKSSSYWKISVERQVGSRFKYYYMSRWVVQLCLVGEWFFFVGKENAQVSGEKSSLAKLKSLKREEAGGTGNLCFPWMSGLCGTLAFPKRRSCWTSQADLFSVLFLVPCFGWFLSLFSLPTHVPVFLLNLAQNSSPPKDLFGVWSITDF